VLKPLLERIRGAEVLLADGALGTMLMERGLRSGGCPDEFVLLHSEVLQGIAREYRAAGAEIMTTDTFGASPLKLASYGLADKVGEINRRAVELMRAVVEDAAYVFADIGPSGKIVKPYGDTESGKVRESYERQMAVLAEAGIDAFSLETMIDLAEAVIAVKAAKAVASAIPVIALMTFEHRRKGFFTVMGNDVRQVAEGLAEAGADIIGANCGSGIEQMIEIARELRAVTNLPTSFRPNAGLPQMTEAGTSYLETPEFMAGMLPELLDAGVSIVGGCCGTTPDHIRAFRQVLDRRAGR
jgi:5-methyltetrahydrofolate--homocysteine methyltransferase